MIWLISILAMFLGYMAFDTFLFEYSQFKKMEYERYMEWLKNNRQ